MILEKLENSKLLGCPTKCFKREVLENVRFLEECYYEDVSFTMEAMCNVKKESDFTVPFTFYRYVQNSITKTKEISPKKMIDVLLQIARLYYLCDQFPQYAKYIIKRIKNDKLDIRLEILNEYFETGYNSFSEKFRK